jgi:hypothetical protein
VIAIQPIDVASIPVSERAALAWRLRTILHHGDFVAAKWRWSMTPQYAEIARYTCVRGELLALVAELEGARPAALEGVG